MCKLTFVFIWAHFQCCTELCTSKEFGGGGGIIITIIIVLSSLYRIFTVIYLKQTMFLGYIMFQRFCSYNLWHISCYATCRVFCTFTLVLSNICVMSNMAVFYSSLILCFLCVVIQVLSEWFWDGSSCPCYDWYHYCFDIPPAQYFYC